ncbi:MAG: thiol-disulfide oxidoreductase DCC [Acidobacteria bacterium]|jgi:predicted DCC family thiol-disulfide oxidoreductase YuxK|nr:MAG: thiol-disulfide oxidoreductase DCC [Acidobacteriota bacterium]
MSGATENLSGPVVLYDGVCGLCNSMVKFVLRHDKRKVFKFAALQGRTAQAILRLHGESPGSLDTMYVVLNSGERLLSRSDAALFIGRELGGGWSTLAAVFGFLPESLRDWIYNRIARNRYRLFGQYQSCPLPDASVQERFLE